MSGLGFGRRSGAERKPVERVFAIGPDLRNHPSMHDYAEKLALKLGCKVRYGKHQGLIGAIFYVDA